MPIHWIFGAQNETYELAVTINEYLGFISTAVIASGCNDWSVTNLRSWSIDGTLCLVFLKIYTLPSVLPLKMYSPFGVKEASIGMFNVFFRPWIERNEIKYWEKKMLWQDENFVIRMTTTTKTLETYFRKSLQQHH